MVKIRFDPTDTIYDVRDRMSAQVEANRGVEQKNFVDKLARGVLAVPCVPTLVVGLVRLLDRYGLCPGALLDELPFHTGMFITNNASIGLHHVNHHIYNFGSTSLFFGMGTVERSVVLDGDGKPRLKRMLPIGITADERVCSGAHYAGFFATMSSHLNNPELLEVPPEARSLRPQGGVSRAEDSGTSGDHGEGYCFCLNKNKMPQSFGKRLRRFFWETRGRCCIR